jgi:hypothetical protein
LWLIPLVSFVPLWFFYLCDLRAFVVNPLSVLCAFVVNPLSVLCAFVVNPLSVLRAFVVNPLSVLRAFVVQSYPPSPITLPNHN